MVRKISKRRHSWPLRIGLLIVLLLIIAALLASYFHFHHKNNTINDKKTVVQPTTPGTKRLSSSNGVSQGTATSKNGSATVTTNANQWTISQSGAITVKEPASNELLQSGDTLAGSATVSQIEYRIIDNQVGQIAEGPLNVVDGKFSATLNFTSHSTSGQLDVFSYGVNGVEINEVQVPIVFSE